MRVECAVLCDAATVREGLLHIIGAGVVGTTAQSFPHYLHVTFAFRAILESREVRDAHELRVAVRDAQNDVEVAQTGVTFTRGPDTGAPETALVFPVSLEGVEIPRTGLYLVDASLDATHVASIPFRVDFPAADEDLATSG
jgi:uncharacterized protein DUF6941